MQPFTGSYSSVASLVLRVDSRETLLCVCVFPLMSHQVGKNVAAELRTVTTGNVLVTPGAALPPLGMWFRAQIDGNANNDAKLCVSINNGARSCVM